MTLPVADNLKVKGAILVKLKKFPYWPRAYPYISTQNRLEWRPGNRTTHGTD